MITVVVPAFDAEATLGACLDALAAQTPPAGGLEIIVVDDGSTDATGAIAGRHPVSARLIAQPHAGAAAARNRGAAAAAGDLLLFTDADCRPAPDWAARMAAPFADPRVAGVKGRFRSDQRALVARLAQAEYEEKEEAMLRRDAVAFADTASAAYRADVFRAAGGFRTELRAVEDTELAFRLAAAGHRLVMAPDAFVYHRHPETAAAYLRRKLRYGLWGASAYLAHPRRVADDSRTPRAMQLQLAVAPLGLAALAAAPLGAGPRAAAVALCGVFGASAAPFAWRARRAGRDAAVAAPLLCLGRALALDAGLAIGLARCAADGLRRRWGHRGPA